MGRFLDFPTIQTQNQMLNSKKWLSWVLESLQRPTQLPADANIYLSSVTSAGAAKRMELVVRKKVTYSVPGRRSPNINLVGGAITILKNIGQWEGWHPIYEMENNIAMFQSAPTRNWYPLVAKDFLIPNNHETHGDPLSVADVMQRPPYGELAQISGKLILSPLKQIIYIYNIILLCCMIMYDLPIYPSIDPSINRIQYYQHQSPGNHTPKHRSSRPAKARWAGAPGSSSPGRPKGLGRIYSCRSVS